MIDTIKSYALGFFAFVSAVFVALFFYEKRKADTSGVLLQNAQVESVIQKEDVQVAQNNQALQTEEEKRKAIVNAPPDNAYSIVDFFNKRK